MYEQNRDGTLTVVRVRRGTDNDCTVTIMENATSMPDLSDIPRGKRTQLHRLAKKATGSNHSDLVDCVKLSDTVIGYILWA